jgi:hypothetical protein
MNGKAKEFVTTNGKMGMRNMAASVMYLAIFFVFMFGYLPSFNRFLVAGPTTPMALNPYLV